MNRIRWQAVLIPGFALIILSFMLIASSGARAVDVTGTWTSTVAGEGIVQECEPADWHYDAKLTLKSDGTGSMWMKVSRVTDVQPGCEDAYDTVGNTFTYDIQYTVSGSSVSMSMTGILFPLTVSGGKMTGSGSYDYSGDNIHWTIDLKGGSGGGLGGLTEGVAPLGAVAVAGAAIGLGASFLPPPVASAPPPLKPPIESIHLPLEPKGTTTGNHLVPTDAPRQEGPQHNPEGYNYPAGTSVAVRCPYCGQQTLSPFTTGWFCTNTQCPARRGNYQGGLHTDFNSMTWRSI